jgi:hypothetical protein
MTTTTTTATATTTNLPTVWIDPPVPLVVNPSSGAGNQPYLDLFDPASLWPTGLSGASAFTITSNFVLEATSDQLMQVMAYLKAHDIQLSLTIGVIPTTPGGIGLGTEGYVSQQQLAQTLHLITAAGGTVSYLMMDDPLYYGTQYNGVHAEQASVATVAQQVATSIALIQTYFPNIQVVDSEGPTTAPEYAAWAADFQQATGLPITTLFADTMASDPKWQADTEAQAAAARAAGVSLSLLVDGSGSTAQAWTQSADTIMAKALADPLIAPSSVQIISWSSIPMAMLPEGLPNSLTNVVVQSAEVAPLYESGVLTGGVGVTGAFSFPNYAGLASTFNAVAGAGILLPGLSVAATGSASATTEFAAVITAATGTLSAAASGSGTATGSGTDVVTLTGTLATIDAELASLSYLGAAPGADTIGLTLYDGQGLLATNSLAVNITAAANVAPSSTDTLTQIFQNIYGSAPSTAQLAAAQAVLNSTNSLTQATAPWLAQAQADITTLFASVENAAPSAQDLATWSAALANGSSLASIRASVATSSAAGATLTSIWNGVYGQNPTAQQLTALQTALAGGQSFDTVTAPLVAGSSAQTQISTVYAQVTGAAPAADVLLHLTQQLLLGTPLASIQTTLAQSAAVSATLTQLYENLYGTPITSAVLAGYEAQLAASTTMAQINTSMANAAARKISCTFSTVLNRTPTSSELSGDVTKLKNGTPLTMIRSNLAYSSEAQGLLNADYLAATGVAPSAYMTTQLEMILGGAGGGMSLNTIAADMNFAETNYKNLLGTAPAEQDILNTLQQFELGNTQAQVQYWMANSSAGRNELIGLFQTAIGMAPSATQLPVLVNELATTSLATTSAYISALAAADVPVISNMAPSESVPKNGQTLPLSAIQLSDPQPNQMVTATVTLSAPVGTLAGGGGTISNNGLTFTSLTWNAAAVQNWLRGLTFYPNASNAGTNAQMSVTLTNALGHSTNSVGVISTSTVQLPQRENMMFLSGQGDTMTLNSLASEVVVPAGQFGQNVINGFNPVNDIIQLPKSEFASMAAVNADLSAVGGGTLLRLDSNDTISLPGVAPSSLSAQNFVFV